MAICNNQADTNTGMKVIPSQSISIVQGKKPVNRRGGPDYILPLPRDPVNPGLYQTADRPRPQDLEQYSLNH